MPVRPTVRPVEEDEVQPTLHLAVVAGELDLDERIRRAAILITAEDHDTRPGRPGIELGQQRPHGCNLRRQDAVPVLSSAQTQQAARAPGDLSIAVDIGAGGRSSASRNVQHEHDIELRQVAGVRIGQAGHEGHPGGVHGHESLGRCVDPQRELLSCTSGRASAEQANDDHERAREF